MMHSQEVNLLRCKYRSLLRKAIELVIDRPNISDLVDIMDISSST